MDAPHDVAEAVVIERLGRRREALGILGERVLIPLVLGLTDQLSAYLDCRPTARLAVGEVHLRQGAERAYLLVALRDRGRPLRMRGVMSGWDVATALPAGGPDAWVEQQNARRWRFLDHNRELLARLFERAADAVMAYYARRPGVHLEPAADAMPRLIEGVDATYLTLEFDDRSAPLTSDSRTRAEVR